MFKIGRSSTSRGLLAVAASLVALAIGVLTPTARADTLTFDPDGAGPVAGAQVNSFNELPGNALAQNAQLLINQLIANPQGGTTAPFFTLYQAKVGTITNAAGGIVFSPSLNTGATQQITATAGFWERAIVPPGSGVRPVGLTSLAPGGQPDPQPGSFLQLYANTSLTASDETGQGFQTGTLILNATVIPGSISGSYLPQFNPDGSPVIAPHLDNNNGGPESGEGPPDTTPSVTGAGGTQLSFQITGFDSRYFPSLSVGTIFRIFFNTSNATPYSQTEPSDLFYTTGSGAAIGTSVNKAPDKTPLLGATNGIGTGPDFQLQSTATFSITAVPEPGTFSLALSGIGLITLGGYRTARRRAGTPAA